MKKQLDRYVHMQAIQLAQATGCTRFHLVEARLARWLLTTRDRAQSSMFHITQRTMAAVLGVRRSGITDAAISLQNRGLIHYCRGEIAILDRPGLLSASCACYQADRDTYRRILG